MEKMDHVIFSANADSIDSWDMENLKYLRKLSIRNPDVETLSYISDRDDDEDAETLLDSLPPLINETVTKVLTPHPAKNKMQKLKKSTSQNKSKGFLENQQGIVINSKSIKPVLTSTTLPASITETYPAPEKSIMLTEFNSEHMNLKRRNNAMKHKDMNTESSMKFIPLEISNSNPIRESVGNKIQTSMKQQRNSTTTFSELEITNGRKAGFHEFNSTVNKSNSRTINNSKIERRNSEELGEIIPSGFYHGTKDCPKQRIISEFQPIPLKAERVVHQHLSKSKRNSIAVMSLDKETEILNHKMGEFKDDIPNAHQKHEKEISKSLRDRRKSVAVVNSRYPSDTGFLDISKLGVVGLLTLGSGVRKLKDEEKKGRRLLSLEPTKLEDCYVMDVMMLRNESVSTSSPSTDESSIPNSRRDFQTFQQVDESPIRIRELIERSLLAVKISHPNGNSSGSSNSPTPSASASSDDSFTSAIEKGFFDMDRRSLTSSSQNEEEQQRYSGGVVSFSGKLGQNESPKGKSVGSKTDDTMSPSLVGYTRVDRSTLRRITNNSDDGCPLCGGCGRSDSFQYKDTRNLPSEDRTDLLEGASLAPTYGGEPPPIDMPKTPSPYYMRPLGGVKGFIPKSLRSEKGASVQPPMNFSLNPAGNLVIDYSSNWSNLESYVQTLNSSTFSSNSTSGISSTRSMTDLSKSNKASKLGAKSKNKYSLKSSYSE